MPGTPSALLNSTSCTRNTATPWYKLKFEPIDTVNNILCVPKSLPDHLS